MVFLRWCTAQYCIFGGLFCLPQSWELTASSVIQTEIFHFLILAFIPALCNPAANSNVLRSPESPLTPQSTSTTVNNISSYFHLGYRDSSLSVNSSLPAVTLLCSVNYLELHSLPCVHFLVLQPTTERNTLCSTQTIQGADHKIDIFLPSHARLYLILLCFFYWKYSAAVR